ncbi:MAG TPA: Uma2 family endonuclease [Thermoanaerobaculia bacterium]
MSAHPHEHDRATYADLERLPDNVVGELIDGELYASPQPGGPHVLAASSLGIDIGSAFHRGRGGPGGWWILDEPELHFVENELVLVPDLGGWRRERLPNIPRDHRFRVAPDWVCEVLSPTTTRLDWAKKLPIYARFGVPFAWFVDPLAQTVQVMQLTSEQYTMAAVFSGDDKMRGEPFEAIEIECSTLWAPPAPDSSPAL